MAQLEAGDITQAVIDRMADCTDERFKTVMTALVKHAHAFLREVEPSEAEWIGAIEFLTATGKKCDDKRQEFILLSDTLGISMLVVALNQAKAARALTTAGAPLPTEATVQGPFYWEGSPELELGADIGAGRAVLGEGPASHDHHEGRVARGTARMGDGPGQSRQGLRAPEKSFGGCVELDGLLACKEEMAESPLQNVAATEKCWP